MLPQYRWEDCQYAVPKFDIRKEDIEGFLEELRSFHEVYRDCFLRSELRENFYRYMAGQFSDLERKSIEPIALNVGEGGVRAMQRFVSDARWEDDRILDRHQGMVNEDLGDPDGALIFDESGFVKKGTDSVGVARQYCGTIGKVDNCQVGVFAAYVSPHGYALVDKRLYMPKQWFTEPYEERRQKCDVPEGIAYRSKAALAAEMLRDIAGRKHLPFRYILADSIYGDHPEFIEAAEGLTGAFYFVSIPSDTLCWLKAPVTRKKRYYRKGEWKEKTVVESTEKKPIPVATLAENLHNFYWYRRTVQEGTKGPILYEFARRRIHLSKNGVPGKSVWLILKRTMTGERKTWYYLSNAPRSTRLPRFVWLSGLRWAIEQCFQETKGELGVDHYEVRKFPGWHHHMLTCMLAHFFLWHLKIRLGKKSTVHYFIAA